MDWKFNWIQGRDQIQLPHSGLLCALSGDNVSGSLGYRSNHLVPDQRECLIWHEMPFSGSPWNELIERVTQQARKSKYKFATVMNDKSCPEELELALMIAGFEGNPLARRLSPDAPDDLQPYLDWKGRVVRIAEGKGSESVNARLYEMIARYFPQDGHYTEKEVNAFVNTWHTFGDQSGVRRELIDRGHLLRTRDCRAYWKAPG